MSNYEFFYSGLEAYAYKTLGAHVNGDNVTFTV